MEQRTPLAEWLLTRLQKSLLPEDQDKYDELVALYTKETSKRFYVSYEEYSELNQFEGCWDAYLASFDCPTKAAEYANSLINGPCKHEYRNVIGPLKPIDQE